MDNEVWLVEGLDGLYILVDGPILAAGMDWRDG